MAATRPMAVANRASAMPGATTARLVFCEPAMAEKLFMMPQTVPNSPIKGAVDALAEAGFQVAVDMGCVVDRQLPFVHARAEGARHGVAGLGGNALVQL